MADIEDVREFMDKGLAARAEVDRLTEEFGGMWFVTFGAKYAVDSHPGWDKAHPDAVLGIKASSYEAARLYVLARLRTAWSDLLDNAAWRDSHDLFPRGCMEIWTVPAVRVWEHPQGKTIWLWDDDTMMCQDAAYKRKPTSATPEKLRAESTGGDRFGAWAEVPST
jgi:hypothetical protein